MVIRIKDKQTKEGIMVTGRRGRGRWRRGKSRRKLEKVAKNQGRNTTTEAAGGDPPDKLLLSALKYWEVERDLIEERMASMRSATAAS